MENIEDINLISYQKKTALMQPCYIPWLGLFHMLSCADIIVWLDDFQFVKGSFHSRNKIFSSQSQFQWLSIPKSTSLGNSIRETLLCNKSNWKRKHVTAIALAYNKAKNRKELEPIIEYIIKSKEENLADFNINILILLMSLLNINIEIHRSSSFKILNHGRSDRVREILNCVNADCYLSAAGSEDYMRQDGGWDNIPVFFQQFKVVSYPQIGSQNFVDYLSVIDIIANIGLKATVELINKQKLNWKKY